MVELQINQLKVNNGQRIVILTLNRPKQLNALSNLMLRQIKKYLLAWEQDELIVAVFIHSSEENVFCAGADVKEIYSFLLNNSPEQSILKLADEYMTDYAIHKFTKPIIAWCDGIVMGGGVGLMQGCAHKIATENTVFAMPENKIGFFPDVGASYFFNKIPNNLGLFFAITGCQLNATDSRLLGLTNRFITSDYKNELLDGLSSLIWTQDREQNNKQLCFFIKQIEALSLPALPQSEIEANQLFIRDVLDSYTLPQIIKSILNTRSRKKWVIELKKNVQYASPLSQLLAFYQLKRSVHTSLKESFMLELDLGLQILRHGEFIEGVRALLIDKDKKPQWQYKTVHDISPETIQEMFKQPWVLEEHPLAHI